MMRHIAKWMLVVFVVLGSLALYTTDTAALSVAPALKMIPYEAGGSEQVRIRILNPEKADFKVLVYAKGELADQVEFEDSIVPVTSSEGEKHIYYTLNMPENLQPGNREADIVLLELPNENTGTLVIKDDGEVVVTSGKKTSTVSAKNGVISRAQVKVPYPDKFVQSRLEIRGQRLGEPVEFILPTYNLGKEEIKEAYAEIDIMSLSNVPLATFKTQTAKIPTNFDVNLRAQWSDYPDAGTYYAIAHLIYDRNVLEYKKFFIVGEPIVEITNISVRDFNLGDVAKLDLTVKGKWNQVIPNVYVDMSVFDSLEERLVGEYKTPEFDVTPYVPDIVRAYWDTFGLSEGTYVMQLDLHYAEKTETVKFDLYVAQNQISTEFDATGLVVGDKQGFLTRDMTLVIIVIILIIANIYLGYLVKKRMGGGKKPPAQRIQPPSMEMGMNLPTNPPQGGNRPGNNFNNQMGGVA